MTRESLKGPCRQNKGTRDHSQVSVDVPVELGSHPWSVGGDMRQAATDTAKEKETPQGSLLTMRELGSHPRLGQILQGTREWC